MTVTAPLALGETYAAELERLSEVVAAIAIAAYDRVLSSADPEELQPAFRSWLGVAAGTAELAQSSAITAANGYLLAAGGSVEADVETGETVGIVGVDVFGRPIMELLAGVPAKVYLALAQGREFLEALEVGRHAARAVLETVIRDTAREALGRGMEASPAVKGWRHWSRGTCSACLAADDGNVRSDAAPQRVHPFCRCTAEPVFDVTPPEPVVAEDPQAEAMMRYMRETPAESTLTKQRFQETFRAAFPGPEARAFEKTVGSWLRGRYRVIRADVERVLAGESGTIGARKIVAALRAAGPDAPALFRGMILNKKAAAEFVESMRVGASFDLPLSSFTQGEKIARAFAGLARSSRAMAADEVSVTIRLESSARALKVDGFSAGLNEREWLSAGRFRVTSHTRRGNRVYITIEQVAGI